MTSLAALAVIGLAAIPVRNMAAVMRLACAPTSTRYSPARLGFSSGFDPSASAREPTIGAMTPPPRAVLDGTTGPKMSSDPQSA